MNIQISETFLMELMEQMEQVNQHQEHHVPTMVPDH